MFLVGYCYYEENRAGDNPALCGLFVRVGCGGWCGVVYEVCWELVIILFGLLFARLGGLCFCSCRVGLRGGRLFLW